MNENCKGIQFSYVLVDVLIPGVARRRYAPTYAKLLAIFKNVVTGNSHGRDSPGLAYAETGVQHVVGRGHSNI